MWVGSPFDEPSVLVEVQEELEPGKLRKVTMHVGRSVLRQIPFFEPQLGEELSGTNVHIRMPHRCSAEALDAVFRRMYGKELVQEKLQLEILLPMAHLACMLCLDSVQAELLALIRHCVKNEAHVKMLTEWCASIEVSDGFSQLVKSYERKGFMMEMEQELQSMIVNTVKSPGDGETMKLIEKLFKKRANKGADMIQKNMNLLRTVFVRDKIFKAIDNPRQREAAIHPLPGTGAFFKVVADLAIAAPETFHDTTRMMFQTSIRDPRGFTTAFVDTTRAMIDKTVTHILDQLPHQSGDFCLSGEAIGKLIALLAHNGILRTSCREAFANVFGRLGQDQQNKLASCLKTVDPSNLQVIANKAVLETFLGDARVHVCKRLIPVMSSLDAETRTFLVGEMFGGESD